MNQEDIDNAKIQEVSETKLRSKDGKTISIIQIEFKSSDDATLARNYFSKLGANEKNKIAQFVPAQGLDRFRKLDSYSYSLRKQGFLVKIREGKFDYKLLKKSKSDTTPWNDIPPMINPHDLPRFRVGKLNEEAMKVLISEEERRKNRRSEEEAQEKR